GRSGLGLAAASAVAARGAHGRRGARRRGSGGRGPIRVPGVARARDPEGGGGSGGARAGGRPRGGGGRGQQEAARGGRLAAGIESVDGGQGPRQLPEVWELGRARQLARLSEAVDPRRADPHAGGGGDVVEEARGDVDVVGALDAAVGVEAIPMPW